MFANLAVLLLLSPVTQDQHRVRPNIGSYMMDFTTVYTGDQGGAAPADLVVVKSASQWDKLRAQIMVSDEKNAELTKLHGPLGAMDWGREQLVFARTGQERTGGYSASVTKITLFKTTGTWKLELKVTPPKPGMLTTDALTNPFVVFRMHRATGNPQVVISRK